MMCNMPKNRIQKQIKEPSCLSLSQMHNVLAKISKQRLFALISFVLENIGHLCYHVMDSLLFLDVLPLKLLFKNNF